LGYSINCSRRLKAVSLLGLSAPTIWKVASVSFIRDDQQQVNTQRLGRVKMMMIIIIIIMSMERDYEYISELRPSTVLLFIPQVTYEHGDPR
jgi:hypothetical protein